MPKLSKKDKEKQKKQEAEKKAQEEEEARILAEKEERERKEQEKREAEEWLIRENEECKMRKIQLAELDSLYDNLDFGLLEEKSVKRTQNKWARYMKCDGSPDPTILPSINMYMSLWHEDKGTEFKAILTESELVLKLIEELETIIEDSAYDPDFVDAKRDQYRNTIVELQSLLQEKLDLGSHGVMIHASAIANPETGNLEYSLGNSATSLCLWGNLSKNPRIKSYEFLDKGLFFELPKVLTLTDCVVRALFTKYDHLSQHSISYQPKIKQKEIESVTPVLDLQVSNAEEEEEEEEMEKELTVRTAEATDVTNKDEKDQDVMEILKKIQTGEDVEKKEATEELPLESAQSVRPCMETDYVIHTPEPIEYEDFDGDEDAVDLRAFQVVGGVFHFNLLQMPPQPKVVKNWTIMQLVEPPELEHLNYSVDLPKPEPPPPPPPATQVIVETAESKSSIKESKSKSKSNTKLHSSKSDVKVETGEKKENSRSDIKLGDKIESTELFKAESDRDDVVQKPKKGIEGPPILVTLKLPEDVCFCEEPQIVRWDDKEKLWRTDGFVDKMYTEASRQLTFRTAYFTTLALTQDSHVNMPFQSWELRPRGVNHAQLTIIAAVVEVEIQIKDELVCLSQPNSKPELIHLINIWMSVSDLMKKMQMAGVNVFPAEDSFKYVKISDKNAAAEFRFYRQMALVASSMAFSWSRWNTDVEDRERIIVQMAEQSTDEPLLEDQWWLCMVTKKRCARLKMNEFDETFNDELDNTEYYADMYHMTKAIASEVGQERVDNTSKNFVDAACRLLTATRVITFA